MIPISRRTALLTLGATALTVATGCSTARIRSASNPAAARRILFLGDSITYAATWVQWVETACRLRHPAAPADFINLGLPSETVSGLSEAGHAGGAFPRPDLHERLERALSRIQPDLVVACYGMNDGIYFPYSDERAARHHDGLRRLRHATLAAGARIVHLTPPVFDPLPLEGRTLPAGLDAYPSPYVGYDDVLHRYSEWLLERRRDGWEVVDVHGSMARFIANRRMDAPEFTLAGDGVHPDATGHWLIARELLRHWGFPAAMVDLDSPDNILVSHPRGRQVHEKVVQRQTLLRDSWLTAVGHLRPGLPKGRPIAEITPEADRLLAEIQALING